MLVQVRIDRGDRNKNLQCAMVAFRSPGMGQRGMEQVGGGAYFHGGKREEDGGDGGTRKTEVRYQSPRLG